MVKCTCFVHRCCTLHIAAVSLLLVVYSKSIYRSIPGRNRINVLDNARYQHCFVVKTFARSLGIHLLFLPSYSPTLNMIEWLWKFTKKKILYAYYYDSPAKFHYAITNFFQNINQTSNNKLQKLLALNFQFPDKNIAHFYAA
ncbi:transposase [Agriterribacter sp.]|uniref:transposase n=1 Tax=Agriterribacter sp. TaxID=2821509 RepID=UPI0039C86184